MKWPRMGFLSRRQASAASRREGHLRHLHPRMFDVPTRPKHRATPRASAFGLRLCHERVSPRAVSSEDWHRCRVRHGAQVAAVLANAGVPVTLLDLCRRARAGLQRAQAIKPDPRSPPGDSSSLCHTAASTAFSIASDDRLDCRGHRRRWTSSAGCWNGSRPRRDDSIVSSTRPYFDCGPGSRRTDVFRRHWLGTHFFNPPRSAPARGDRDRGPQPRIADHHRGLCRPSPGQGRGGGEKTPNFIGNRISALFERGVVSARRLTAGD